MEGVQNWYKNELEKDKKELEYEKQQFINSIKRLKKDEIIPKPTEKRKISLWKRIIKTLMGD